MGSSNISTAREALMAELLQDADLLVRRFEQVDEALAEKIERAAADAGAKAFLAFKLNFESVIEKDADKLLEAGKYAAAQMGNQLSNRTAQLVALNSSLERKVHGWLLLVMGVALAAGAIGGFIGAKLGGA